MPEPVNETVTLRRAGPGDADFLVQLLNRDDVDPFLGPHRPRDVDTMLQEIERSQREPESCGQMIVEVDGRPAGALAYKRVSESSRIAHLGGLAIHPEFRGRRLADEAALLVQRYLIFELGYHRLELAVYGFNERAVAHAERAGFVREGLKRKAYLRHGTWQDAVQFGLIREDLGGAPVRLPELPHT